MYGWLKRSEYQDVKDVVIIYLTDITTLNINEYPITTELKQEIYTNGGNNKMSRTLYEAFKDEIVKEREGGMQQGCCI